MTEDEQVAEDGVGTPVEGNGEVMWLMDSVAFGRRIKSIRIDEGFDRAEDFIEAVRRVTRVDVRKHTMWAIERGEQPPTVEQLVAFIVTLKLHKGILAFDAAIRSDIVDKLEKLNRP